MAFEIDPIFALECHGIVVFEIDALKTAPLLAPFDETRCDSFDVRVIFERIRR